MGLPLRLDTAFTASGCSVSRFGALNVGNSQRTPEELFMKSTHRMLVAAVVALGALGAAGAAHARSDVFWSVGVGGPGVSVGVGWRRIQGMAS